MRRDFQVPCSRAEHNFERRWWWPHLGWAKVSQHAAASNFFLFSLSEDERSETRMWMTQFFTKANAFALIKFRSKCAGSEIIHETPRLLPNILCISDWKFYSFFMFSAIKWNQKFTNWFMRRHLSWYCVMFSYLWKQKARSADNVCDINPLPVPALPGSRECFLSFSHYSCFYCLENCFSTKFLHFFSFSPANVCLNVCQMNSPSLPKKSCSLFAARARIGIQQFTSLSQKL